mmetsp:Transcript_119688/g.238393  ORF Transcript_119688/g.238393 Transcript_119688/m.238393 type:complete len:82 (-) Transcript_119688:165-410(-)
MMVKSVCTAETTIHTINSTIQMESGGQLTRRTEEKANSLSSEESPAEQKQQPASVGPKTIKNPKDQFMTASVEPAYLAYMS